MNASTNTIQTRKPKFSYMAKEATINGGELDTRTFKKHQKQYAEYKLGVLKDFLIEDRDALIYLKLMACHSFVEMDRVARKFIEAKLNH